MNVELVLTIAVYIALGMLMLAMLLTSLRVIKGPTVADRVLALDQLVAIAIGFIAVIAIKTGYTLYVDIALALGLVGFLATVAFARYIYFAGKGSEAKSDAADKNAGEQS